MAAFAGAHGETVAKNIVQDLMGGAASPYKRVNELLNYFGTELFLPNMIVLELPVNSPDGKKIRIYVHFNCSRLWACWFPSGKVLEPECSMASTSRALWGRG